MEHQCSNVCTLMHRSHSTVITKLTLTENVKIITKQMITNMVSLSDLLGTTIYIIINILSQYMNTGSSVLESWHCRRYVYYKWWYRVIIKHMWHKVTGTNEIFSYSRYSELQCYSIYRYNSSYIFLLHNLWSLSDHFPI